MGNVELFLLFPAEIVEEKEESSIRKIRLRPAGTYFKVQTPANQKFQASEFLVDFQNE